MTPKAAVIAIAFVLVALLALVIIVGLAQQRLDPTGVAVMLGSVLSGAVVGIVMREKSKDDES